MIKNNQNPNEWLIILHNSFNLFGVIFLTVIWAENSIDDSFWSSVPLIIFFAYGVLSGLMHGEKSKYILFRKSFWIALLVIIWAFIFLGILSVEKEGIGFWEYLNIVIRGAYSFAPYGIMYFLGLFLVGYVVAIFAKTLKNLILKLFDYATKYETKLKPEDKFAIFHWSLILTALYTFLLIIFESSFVFLLVFLSTGSSLYGILSGIFRKKEAKSVLLRKPFAIFFLTLIMLILVLSPIIMAEEGYSGNLTEELLMSATMVAMAELIWALIPFIFGLLLGNIIGLVFFVYNKFIDFFNQNIIYNFVYKIFVKLVIISVSGIYIGIIWFWISLLSFDGFYSPIYVFDLYDQDKYYQNHIGKKLVEYGQEYEINNINTSNWKNYKDKENKFQFKYPANLEIEMRNMSMPYRYQLNFSGNDYGNVCEVEISSRERGVGREWLPKIRNRFDYDVRNSDKGNLWYFYAKDGKIFSIYSTNFQKEINNSSDNYKFTYVDFISENSLDKFIKISDSGNTCPEYLIKGILKTFEFVE